MLDSNSTERDVARIELRLPAGAEWVRVARLTVAGVASRLPFPIDAVEDIKLAVSEAINNAIQHVPQQGQQSQGAPVITLIIETSPDGLWVSVADQGRLDVELEGRKMPWGDELPEGGLGLMLIRSLMDRVDHQSGPQQDTVVRMFKAVPPLSTPAARVGARPPVVR